MGEDLLIDQSSLANPADHAIEYIVETIFHKKDAFPEQPGHHHRHPLQMHKTISFKLFSYYSQVTIPVFCLSAISLRWALSDENVYQYTSEINPPPPKQ